MNYDIPGTTSKQVEKPWRQKVIFGLLQYVEAVLWYFEVFSEAHHKYSDGRKNHTSQSLQCLDIDIDIATIL